MTIFLIIAFAVAWLMWLPLLWAGEVVRPGQLPTHMVGLMAPALAAFVAAGLRGQADVQELWRRVTRVADLSWRAWAMTLSPFLVLAAVILISAIQNPADVGQVTAALGVYSGVPQLGVPLVVLVIFIANCLGEEIGWRGYALPKLQQYFGVMPGTLVLFVVWAAWHLPLFFIVATFMQMNLVMIIFGWGLGLLAGSIVLANVTHVAKGAIIAPALWHLGFNLTTATALGGLAPALATTGVMIWAVVVVGIEIHGRRSSILTVVQG